MNPNTEYEKFTQEIYQELINAHGINTVDVKHNVKIAGKSGQKHQIDVFWQYEINGVEHKVIIECKNYNSEISVGKVRDFFGVLTDLTDLTNVSGIIVTKVGYQKGAKKYAYYYNINLKELRSPNEKDDCIVGRLELNWGISRTTRLFLLDNDWANEHDINWQSYRSRISIFSGRESEWEDDYFPMETIKGANIIDEEGKLIETLDKLEAKLLQNNDHSQDFENAYIDTRYWGRVKIKAIKFTTSKTNETKIFAIDARNIVKAILKDALDGKIMYVLKIS